MGQDFFGGDGLDFGDLEKVEFHWGFASKNRDEDADFALVFVERIDSADKVGKGTLDDFDGVAQIVASFIFGSGHVHEFHDGGHFCFGERSGLITYTDKGGDALGSTHC